MEKQSSDNLHSQYKVIVSVTEPQTDSVKGFTTYLVSGTDAIGTFEIRRRYNDFFYLREALVKKWPAIYIPPIPEKLLKGSKDAENIEIRKKYFDFFLKRLGKIKHLFESPITQQFLRNKAIEMEKFFTTLPNPRFSQLVIQYKKTYEQINFQNVNTGEIRNSISNFSGFLKKAEKELQSLRVQVETIVQARAGFTQHLNTCNVTMLPEYEKNVYLEYLPEDEKQDPKLIFVNNPQVQDNIKLFKEVSSVNSFVSTLDLLTYQILQVKAMEEAYKLREKCQNDQKSKEEQLLKSQAELAKLMSGKTTLKSIFSRGSKNQQIQKIQKDIPQIKRQIQALQQFNKILIVVFGSNELPKFKREKQLQYYKMMYEVSENELKYLSTYGQFMRSIMLGLTK